MVNPTFVKGWTFVLLLVDSSAWVSTIGERAGSWLGRAKALVAPKEYGFIDAWRYAGNVVSLSEDSSNARGGMSESPIGGCAPESSVRGSKAGPSVTDRSPSAGAGNANGVNESPRMPPSSSGSAYCGIVPSTSESSEEPYPGSPNCTRVFSTAGGLVMSCGWNFLRKVMALRNLFQAVFPLPMTCRGCGGGRLSEVDLDRLGPPVFCAMAPLDGTVSIPPLELSNCR